MTKMKKSESIVSTIQRHSVADQVYFDLRKRILSGQIAQGARIVEAAIAKSLNISRAPVREAVNRLTEAGLLESRTHHGTSVIQMTVGKMVELYTVRIAVETLVIREVAKNHTFDDIQKLKQFIRLMEVYAEKGDLAALVEVELAFHEALWRVPANAYIEKISGLLFDHIRLALSIDNAAYGDLLDVAREHEPLLEAIESGDPDVAARALTTHIMASLDKFAKQ